MEKTLALQRIMILDENLKYPVCHVCKSECKPFLIPDDQLEILTDSMRQSGMMFKNGDDTGIFLCIKCIRYKEEQDGTK